MKNFKEVKSNLINKLMTCTDNAKQEFAFLCESLIGINKAEYLIKDTITNGEYRKLLKAINKRIKGVPLQLIIGTTDFLGVIIEESKYTLKPRQETMLMVEKIINTEDKNKTVLDMCAGSGCIGLSLKNAGFKDVTLCDISGKAIKMMQKNAKYNRLDVNIVKSNMFNNVSGKYDIIVSNPPYIKSDDINKLSTEVKKYDPLIALDGGKDGLDFYRILADEASEYLAESGVLYLEIGQNQENDIILLLQKHYKNITIIKDYNNINRIIRAEKC